jgi:hypothetical protein
MRFMGLVRAVTAGVLAGGFVVALPGVASAGTYVVRYDDGTRESSYQLAPPGNQAYKYLPVSRSTIGAATSATVWVYATATGCDAAPELSQQLVVSTHRMAPYDPCVVFPSDGYGWASFDVPLAWLWPDNPGNYVALTVPYPYPGTPARVASYGIDTGSRGHTSLGGGDSSGVARSDVELMVYLSFDGTGPALGAPPKVDYGLVRAGTAATRTVTVTSVGFTAAAVTTVAVSGADAGAYAVTRDACTGVTLAPDESCEVDVTFAPAGLGARTATLTVTGSAGDSVVTSLRGTGASAPPVSAFTTADGAVLLPAGALRGTATDDLGVASEYLTFVPAAPLVARVTVRADLTCTAGGTACTWSYPALWVTPGLYTVSAHATDVQGVQESPDPRITVVVA